MEKLIYPLWPKAGTATESFKQELLGPVAEALIKLPTLSGLRICVVDEDVKPAAPYRMQTLHSELPDAIVSVWLDSYLQRAEVEAVLQAYCHGMRSFLVTESEPLKASASDIGVEIGSGMRSNGMSEVVFLQRPERLSEAEWLDIWHNSHTQIAIDTQCTYGYRQNVVARSLSEGGPKIDAIIEENFEEKAIHSRAAFYDAENDEALYKSREQAMIESCMRFIDFDKIDCIPMSEYIFKLPS